MGEFLKTRGKSVSGEESERDQKRMYSFKQMYQLFRILNNNSDVADRVEAAEKNIEKIYADME